MDSISNLQERTMVPLNILYRFIWSILLQPAKASDVKSWVHYTAHYVTLELAWKFLLLWAPTFFALPLKLNLVTSSFSCSCPNCDSEELWCPAGKLAYKPRLELCGTSMSSAGKICYELRSCSMLSAGCMHVCRSLSWHKRLKDFLNVLGNANCLIVKSKGIIKVTLNKY